MSATGELLFFPLISNIFGSFAYVNRCCSFLERKRTQVFTWLTHPRKLIVPFMLWPWRRTQTCAVHRLMCQGCHTFYTPVIVLIDLCRHTNIPVLLSHLNQFLCFLKQLRLFHDNKSFLWTVKTSQISLGPYSNLQTGAQKEVSNVGDF